MLQSTNPSDVSIKFTQAIVNATTVPPIVGYNDPSIPTGASTQLQYTQSGPNGIFRVSSASAF